MSIGLYVKIVLTAGMWDIFYFCKKNSKKRKNIFKYEKLFIKYAKLVFIFAILVSCIGLCFRECCEYAKLIFKNAKRFSNMKNFVSKTRNLYSFLLNLCKLRRTYSVCAFTIMGYFQICKTFHQKREKIFKYGIFYFKNAKLFAFYAKNEIAVNSTIGGGMSYVTRVLT